MSKKFKKIVPGVAGDTEDEQRRTSRRLCSSVLQGKAVELPKGFTKTSVKKFCDQNRIGSAFAEELPQGVQKDCDKKGLRGRPACRFETARKVEREVMTLDPSKVIAKGSTYVTRTLKGEELQPYAKGIKKPCRAPAKKDPVTGLDKPLRACHVELEFLSPGQASKIGLKTGGGAYLRVCGTKKKTPGGLFKVKSPEEAQEIIKRTCGEDAETRLDWMRNAGQGERAPDGFGAASKRSRNFLGLAGYGRPAGHGRYADGEEAAKSEDPRDYSAEIQVVEGRRLPPLDGVRGSLEGVRSTKAWKRGRRRR